MLEFQTFTSNFTNVVEKPDQDEIEYYINQIKSLERLTIESKRFYILMDHSSYFPAYLSDNFETESGYSFEFLKNQGLLFLFKRMHLKQISFLYNICFWGSRVAKAMKMNYNAESAEIFICGLKLKDKWGKWRSTMMSQKILSTNSIGKARLSFITAEEITYFHSSNTYWYRVFINTEYGSKSKVWFANGKKKEADDIFSDRELDILRLSKTNASILEIAEALDISKNTVERHRKNMISKIGVTNMTGAIRISQILNLI